MHSDNTLYTTGRSRGGRCGAGWRGGSRNLAPRGWCRRRLRGRRRAAWARVLCAPRNRSRRGALRHEGVLLGGFARSREGSRGCCCRCYIPCRAVSAARLRRFAFRVRAASRAPRPPRCRQRR